MAKIPYVAIPSGKCQECDRLLGSVMDSPEGEGFEQLQAWLNHMNTDHKKNG